MKKTSRSRATGIRRTVVLERLRALRDAADAAVESVSEQVGDEEAVIAVTTSLFMNAADMAWHMTVASEEDFIEAARQSFRHVAESHARCARGNNQWEPRAGSPERENLN